MVETLKGWAGPVLYLSWVFWPWVVGAIDVLAWIVVGAQVSPIPWGLGDRGMAAGIWPIAWLAISGLFVAMTQG